MYASHSCVPRSSSKVPFQTIEPILVPFVERGEHYITMVHLLVVEHVDVSQAWSAQRATAERTDALLTPKVVELLRSLYEWTSVALVVPT